MIAININNVNSTICNLNDSDYELLNDELSFEVLGACFTKAYKQGWWDSKQKKWCSWDGYKRLLVKNKDMFVFLTGLLDRIRNCLDLNNIEYEITDSRKLVKNAKPILLKNLNKIEERYYQDEILQKCLSNSRGIVKAATGSGKSIMILKLIAQRNIKTNLYVTGVDLLYQMYDMFKHFGIDVGIIGDGQCNVKKINIISIWTAASALGNKYVSIGDDDVCRKEDFNSLNKEIIANVIKESQMNIWDECHQVSTDTVQVINSASVNSYYSYGFSGTPWRPDSKIFGKCSELTNGSGMLIEGVCGNVIANVTATELITAGFLVQPTIHFINVPKSERKYSKKYPTIYKEYIVNNNVRNDKIVKAAESLISSGRKILILVKSIKHGEILFDKLKDKYKINFLSGIIKSSKRNEIREQFINGEIDILIASIIYDQGLDVPILSGLILAGSGKSSTRALQRIGRVIRLFKNKDSAVVVDFIDNEKYLLDHTKKRIDVYRSEPGFKLKFPKTNK